MRTKFVRRVAALALASALLTVDASAVVKEVMLWGAKSVNDMGGSDHSITMEQLQEDYSGYLQTSGMTEFFHKDQAPTPKTDMTEALAWLIDNGIFNRDESIIITNVNRVPQVTIAKTDMNANLYVPVNRSDALMYIYKSVFGELQGRTVGVETPSVRTDAGSLSLLHDIMLRHGYTVKAGEKSDGTVGKTSNSIDGSPGSGGYGGGANGEGGDGGKIGNVTVEYFTDGSNWRYTPQGDEYTKVFGDTNIFISQNEFNQEVKESQGGTGGMGGSGGSGAPEGGSGGPGGDGGNGGMTGNIINYETDYKSIYFIPGSDILFYRTSDVVEMYLQAIMSKGLLNYDEAIRTPKFAETFTPLVQDNAPLAAWSGNADPYIVNLSIGKHIRVEKVKSAPTQQILGANFDVNYTGSTVQISRRNLFQSNTGYFETEELNRMDLYRYIYNMVYANEKKLSDLERDIVNYKYGMEFDGIATPEDIEVLKYLVAKGILDYNGSTELVNLYGSVSWYDFIPVLYRVANKNARLDFSMVQLTDSEQSWKAKGFYPQTLYLTEDGAVGTASLTLDSYASEVDNQQDGPDAVEEVVLRTFNDITAPRLLGTGVGGTLTNLIDIPEPRVPLAPAPSGGTLTYEVATSGAMTFNGFYFDYRGATYTSANLVSEFKNLLQQVGLSTRQMLLAQSADTFDVNNPKHQIVAYMLKNIYVIGLIQSDHSLYTQLLKELDEWAAVQPAGMSSEIFQLKTSVAGGLRYMLNCASSGICAPTNIRFDLTNGSSVNAPSQDFTKFAQSLKAIRFDMPDTTGAARTTYTFEYAGGVALNNQSAESDVVLAVNNSAVEFKKRVTGAQLQQQGEQETVLKFTQCIGTSLISRRGPNTGDATLAFTQYVDPKGESAFVSWASIEEAMQTQVLFNSDLPIVKVSDMLLYNTETDTYAYFSEGGRSGKAVALVGTAVVSGDSELGVAFKSGEGEAATWYYHVNAIRLLLNAKQETAVISGVHSIALPNDTIKGAMTTIPLISESGVTEGSINGIRALVSANDSKDKVNFATDSAYMNGIVENNERWGDFLSLSQANRVMNIITRRIQYTPTDTAEAVNVAYAVVRFVPVDAEALGTAPVTGSTSLQDLLDAPAQAPSDAAAKAVWSKNKAMCNAFANWIYGTSNQVYIETGYLRPEATLYVVASSERVGTPPTSIFSPLSESERASIKIMTLGKVYSGKVQHIGGSNFTPAAASYYLSKDCEALVTGDRIYLHKYLFTGLSITKSRGEVTAKVSNLQARQAAFTLGSTFYVQGGANLWGTELSPPLKVIETTSDGMVKCQVGPIFGVPLVYGSSRAVVPYIATADGVHSIDSKDFSTRNGINAITLMHAELFKSMPEVKLLGITESPVLVPNRRRTYMFDGSKVNVFDRGDTKSIGSVVVKSASSTDTLQNYRDTLQASLENFSTSSLANCETYFTVEFPAYQYRVRNGYLSRYSSSATEFLSPSLFTSLNDLIIDSMINEANGAIPVNEIPSGSLLKLGNCYYQATGTSTDTKSFIGYAYLNTLVSKPTIQSAAAAFGNQFVRAGNQYMNISHFFSNFKLLNIKDGGASAALSNVAQQTLTLDDSPKYYVDADGNQGPIVAPVSGGSTGGAAYTPVQIEFTPGLLAYKVSAPDAAVPRYTLCTSAANAVAGAFADLPFFTDNILEADLYDRTTDLLTSGFEFYEGAGSLRALLAKEFQKAFAGDLITLARMLMFIVLCWLVLASWVCYCCRLGGIMSILEAIRYPTGNRQRKGLDLFKLVSLGTINMDMDFRLGRFLQYNAILAALLCVVMLTGRITLGG